MEKRVATLYGAATISSVLAIEKIATCESSDVATTLSTILTWEPSIFSALMTSSRTSCAHLRWCLIPGVCTVVVTTARASAPTVTDHQHAHAVRLDEHGHAYDVVNAAHGPTACHSDYVYATTMSDCHTPRSSCGQPGCATV